MGERIKWTWPVQVYSLYVIIIMNIMIWYLIEEVYNKHRASKASGYYIYRTKQISNVLFKYFGYFPRISS